MQVLVWCLVGLPTLAAAQEHVPSIQIKAAEEYSRSVSTTETFEEGLPEIAFDVAVISEGVLDSDPRLWTVDMGGVNLFRLPEPLVHPLNGISPDALIGPVWNHGMMGQPTEISGQKNGRGQFWDLQGMARPAQSSIQILEGNSRDYVISIGQQPPGDVIVDITGHASTDLTVTPSTVTFTASDWSEKPVTLTAADDADAENDDITLTLTTQGSSEPPTQQSITIVDDEIIWELTPKSIEEGAASGTGISIYAPPRLDLGAPSGDVTFTVTGHTGTDLDPVPTTLTFPADKWEDPQQLNLSTKVDLDDQDDQVTLTLTAAGGGYTGLTYSMDVTIDDRPPFEKLIPEGTSILFGLGLLSSPTRPTSDVMGTYSGYQGTDLTVDPSRVTYKADSWVYGPWRTIRHDGRIEYFNYRSFAEEVEIRAGSDSDDQDDQEVLILNVPFPDGQAVQSQIHVRIEDDDDPGLVVSPSSLGIGEGQSESFTVQLSEAPLGSLGTDDVTVQSPRSWDDLSASPSSLTFTTADWNTPKTVSLSAGQDNDSVNDFVEFSVVASGGGFDGERGIVDVTVLDDDDPEIIVSPTEVSVQEGGTASFHVKLATEPVGWMTVRIPAFKDPALSRSRLSLTFTNFRYGHYDEYQTVTVSAGEDNNAVDEMETITLMASGGGYDGVTADVKVTVTDNDIAGAGLVVSSSALDVNEGGTKTFDVSLEVQPTGKVTVSMSDFTDSAALSRAPSTLTFTASNYSTVQTVTVTAHEDADADNETDEITLTASGGGYDNAAPQDVTVNVTDNDVAGAALVIDPSSVVVDEGGTNTFAVSLAAVPKGDVTVTIPALTEPDLSHDRSTLTFTASNYSQVQTVTVTAHEDADTDSESETITLTASGGGYDHAAPKDVTVTVTDNDVAGAALVIAPAPVVVDEGGTSTFDVSLEAAPKGDVTVTIPALTEPDLSHDRSTLTFTTSNYSTGQTVTVTAGEDDNTVSETETITLTASGGGYDHAAPQGVTVNVTDNDVAGAALVIDPASVVVDEGGTSTFAVWLAAAPKGEVTVTIPAFTEPLLSHGTPRLTFTSTDYSAGQPVTVSAGTDENTTNETDELTLTADGGGYHSVTATLGVTIVDQDTDVRSVWLSASPYRVSEGTSVMVTAHMSRALSGEDLVIPLVYGPLGDSGAGPGDYRGPNAVTIAAGARSGSASIEILEDDEVEGDEGFRVGLGTTLPSAVERGSPAWQRITIVDVPPPAGVRLEVDPVSVTEGASVQVGARLSRALPDPVRIPLVCKTITAESGDYACPGAVVISAGETFGSVALGTVMDLDPDDEELTVGIGALPGAVTAEGRLEETVTIQDVTPVVTLSVSPEDAEEGDRVRVTVNLTVALSDPVSVPLVCTPATADPVDYVCPPSVPIAAGLRSGSVDIDLVDDDMDEASVERFTVSLGAVLPSGLIPGSPVRHVVGIIDNDGAEIRLSTSLLRVPEGSAKEYTVRLSSEPASNVIVQITESTGRVTLDPPLLTFTASDWDDARQVRVAAARDENTTPESVSLTHTASSADPGYSGQSAVLPVEVLDAGAPELVIQPPELTVMEGGVGEFTVALATVPSTAVTVAISEFTNPELTRNVDVLTFTSSDWDRPQAVTVSAQEDADAEDEAPETLTLMASGAEYSGQTGRVTVTVMDTDEKTIVLSSSSLDLAEGGAAGRYTVALASAPESSTTVTIPADAAETVRVTPASLVFGPSNWNIPRTVTVQALEDSNHEDETIELAHVASGGGYDGVRATLTVQITDKGEDPLTISIYDARGSEQEGEVDLRVELSRRSAQPVTVLYTAVEGTATAGSDYVDSRGIVIFEPGSTSGKIRMEILRDEIAEPEETFTVELSRARNAEIAQSVGRVTIVDHDRAPRVWIADEVGYEDEGRIRFTVHLSRPGRQSIAVGYRTENGTATAGEDYAAARGVLTFAPGEIEQEIVVELLADEADWGDKTFSVHLQSVGEVRMEKAVALATIREKDSGPVSVMKAYTARFVRTSTGQIVEALRQRLRSQGASCSAGQRAALMQVWGVATDWTPSLGELLAGCRIAQEQPTGRGVVRVWGQGAFTRFHGRGERTMQSDVTAAMLAADHHWASGWLAGVLVAHSRADGAVDPRGAARAHLTGLVPYVSIQKTDWGAWVALGYGRGRAEVLDLQGDLASAFGAAGVRSAWASNSSMGLTAHADVLVAGADVDEHAVSAQVYRVRAGLEADVRVSPVIRPYAEVNVRQDGGSAETGTGLELGGGVRLAYPAWRLKAEVRTQGIVIHSADGFAEWGLSGLVQVGEGPEGLMVSVRPAWGPQHSGMLHHPQTIREVTPTGATLHRMDMETAYGVPLNHGVLRSVIGTTRLATGTLYRLGTELRPDKQVSLSVIGLLHIQDTAPNSLGVNLQGTLRY